MPEPKPVMLTDAEEDWITRKISTDEPTLNVAPLLHAVEDIVAAREAAARREALLEAAEELDALPSYRVAGLYTHERDYADGKDAEAERIADWLRALAEPERDEEPEEIHHCDGCGEDYNILAESHIGHQPERDEESGR